MQIQAHPGVVGLGEKSEKGGRVESSSELVRD